MNRSKLHLLRNMAATLLLCMGFASCSQDDMPQTGGTPLPDGEYPLAFTASVDGMATRSIGKDGWAEGDKIGVRIGADGATGCYELNHENGTVKEVHTPVYWQNTAPATVTAWYPFEAQTAKDIANQSNGYGAIDFLKATAENKRFTDKVELRFIHQMAKVSYTLKKGDGITDEDLNGAAVRIAGYTKASFSEGILTGTDDGWITPTADCEALLVPQDMTGKQLIKVSINGKDFIYTPDTETIGNLKAGCHNAYTITVKANGIEVTMVTGSSWNGDDSEDVSGKEILTRYTANDLKLGDFFYSDGTYSDGGLRTIYTDKTYRIDAAVVPDPNKTCIGIVFQVEQHGSDDADYSATGIGQEKCHGYAVALTDVGKYRWAYMDGGAYSQNAGTSTSKDDWNGYSNQKAIENFADNNSDGWKFEHFEAAYRCSIYGTEKGEDWQRRYAAPVNTSGWFLPSCNQLKTLYNLNHDNANLLATSMENVKSQDSSHICWFGTSEYWSSSENPSNPYSTRVVAFESGRDDYYCYKLDFCYVRAILAF